MPEGGGQPSMGAERPGLDGPDRHPEPDYFDKQGDVPFRPSLTLEAAWRSARFDLDDYAFLRARTPAMNGALPSV